MIVILGAMESEITEFLTALELTAQSQWQGIPQYRGYLEGEEIIISRSGVGKVLAAMRIQHLLDEFHPEAVIFTGLAGSLRSRIAIGDTLLARDLVQHDLESAELGFARGQIPYTELRFIPADPRLLELARRYHPAEGQVHLGRICTGDQFIAHREFASHAYLVNELEGDGVEMEGAAVALVCHLNQVPFLVARTISDQADGLAAVNFGEFLPIASRNSLALIQHLLRQIKAQRN